MVGTIRTPTMFAALLCAATFAPPIFLIVNYGILAKPIEALSPIWAALGFLGSGHVIITIYFYFDSRAKELISDQFGYYVGAPMVLLATIPLIFIALNEIGQHLAILAFYLSAFQHHARQNIGIFGFMSRSFGFGTISNAERRVLTWSFAGSVFAAARWYDSSGLLKDYYSALYAAAVACFVIVGIATVWVVFTEYRRQPIVARSALFTVLAMMFLPSVIFNDWIAGLSWGSAHTLQYWIFLYYASYRGHGEARIFQAIPSGWIVLAVALTLIWPLALLLGISGAYVSVLKSFPNAYAGGINSLIWGLVIAWVGVHYLVDARIWKMTNAKVRAYQSRSFGFMRL